MSLTSDMNLDFTVPGEEQKALDVIRKIGGLAVACGEEHGMPKREAQ